MSKIRNINSIESAVEYAIKSVGVKDCIESIKDLTAQNKSESAIYKWSDPDTDQNIQYRFAIALDIACIKKGIKPPMLSIHQEILYSIVISGSNEKYDLINELLKVNSEIIPHFSTIYRQHFRIRSHPEDQVTCQESSLDLGYCYHWGLNN